jgi:hypothetical protein
LDRYNKANAISESGNSNTGFATTTTVEKHGESSHMSAHFDTAQSQAQDQQKARKMKCGALDEEYKRLSSKQRKNPKIK